MARLQDLDGYPDDLNINEIINGEYSKQEIRDWAIDLLAAEAEPWLDYEDENTSKFSRAVIASCRPLMETMALADGLEADAEILEIALSAHLTLSKCLVRVKSRAIELGLRD